MDGDGDGKGRRRRARRGGEGVQKERGVVDRTGKDVVGAVVAVAAAAVVAVGGERSECSSCKKRYQWDQERIRQRH
jgi:hypothetical protein